MGAAEAVGRWLDSSGSSDGVNHTVAIANSEKILDELRRSATTSAYPQVDTARQLDLVPGMCVKDRFVLREVIGAGGMGTVFKVTDLRKEEAGDANSDIAMKVLGPQFKDHPAALQILQQEAKKAQTLAHPNIITVYDFDRDGDTIYMIMEYLQGVTLDEIRKAAQPLGMPLGSVLPLVEGMAAALAYAHKKDIIHSDFKPGNVFITKDGVVKVLDFGIARARSSAGREPQAAYDPGKLGALTPAYASCEMLEGGAPDPRDDIYALACITYELLAGRHPFQRTAADQARDAKLRPARIKGLSRRQWSALLRGLAFDREQRTADAAEFLHGLLPWRLSVGQGVMLGVIVLLLGGTGYYLYEAQRLSGIVEEELQPAGPVVLTSELKAKVAQYLDAAELYVALGQLASPPGDSAYDVYRKVLEIDPRNERARQGLNDIAERYLDGAREALDANDARRAHTLAQLGLRARPNHKGLQQLRDEARRRGGS